MATSIIECLVVVYFRTPTFRRRLVLSGSALVALFVLLWRATPAHAATIYHVNDSVDDGLVAYYKLEATFDGNATAWDSIGDANGEMRGTSAFSTSGLPPLLKGQNFGKLQMTGVVSDQITITDSLGLGSDFTVAVWVNRGQVNQFQTIFDAGTGSSNGHWYVAIGDSSKSNALLFGRRGAFAEIVSAAVVGNTNWHHIALSHSATNNRLNFYLDGVLITSQANVVLTVFSGAQRIGAVSIDNTTGVAGNFNGNIDDLRVYDRTLSDGEVTRLATGFGCVFDGLSWAKAFGDLQCALESNAPNDVIRVAKGRYLPGISPNAFYSLQSGDIIQGGFNGNEADNAARPPLNLDPSNTADFLDGTKYTILSGDLRRDDPPNAFTDTNTPEDEEEDNLHQIFAVASASIGTSLDGVVVSGGRSEAAGAGGAIGGSPSIANSVFLFNRANTGGGLDIGATASPQLSNLRFIHNQATHFGGGIESVGTLSLNNSRFFSNTAAVAGGGLEVSAKIALLNNVNFDQNLSPLGGGINLSGTIQSLFYNGGEITNNQAENGGGLAANSSSQPVTVTLQTLLVQNNHSGGDGGGLQVLFNINLQILDSTFEGNRAVAQGGAVYILSPQTPAQIANSTFRDNHALTSDGGAIEFCCTSSSLHVDHVVVEENSSKRNGGGISVCCGGGIIGEHLTVAHNQSERAGGGLYICCTDAISTLEQVTVTANSVISDGGGIHLSGGALLTITNGLMTDNQAGGSGGAVFGSSGGQFALLNGKVEGNHSQGPGGAINFTNGTLQLSGVRVAHNQSVNDGGGALALRIVSLVELRQVDFVENTTGVGDGAAIRIRRGTSLMDRVSFQGNGADQKAGALSIEDRAQVTATNALFVGNTGNNGGGAGDEANAIRIQDKSALRLINSTLAANSGAGNGPAVIEGNGVLILSNVILWDNAPPTLIKEVGATLTQQNVISGTPTSATDPRFLRNPDPGDGDWATLNDNDYGDLRLRPLSPAIDQGDGALLPAGIDQDFDGNPRIFDAGFVPNAFAEPVDLGALEARFVAPTAKAGGPYQGDEGQPVALNGSTSSDEGTIKNFAWDCTNDNSDEASSDGPTGDSCIYADQGTFTLRLRVTDSDNISNSNLVTVTIANVDPVAANDNATTDEDKPVIVDVLSNDSDVAADPLTIASVGAPQHGSAVIQAGKVRYTPIADFNGTDTFTYRISDGDGGSATATVTITITPVDDPDRPTGAKTFMPGLAK